MESPCEKVEVVSHTCSVYAAQPIPFDIADLSLRNYPSDNLEIDSRMDAMKLVRDGKHFEMMMRINSQLVLSWRPFLVTT